MEAACRRSSDGPEFKPGHNGDRAIGSLYDLIAVPAGKYPNIPESGEWEDGRILLREHGNAVFFCNNKPGEPQAWGWRNDAVTLGGLRFRGRGICRD